MTVVWTHPTISCGRPSRRNSLLHLVVNNKTSMSFYPVNQLMFFSLLMSWLILSWIGSCPVENPFIITGQVFTIICFSYFLMVPEMFLTLK